MFDHNHVTMVVWLIIKIAFLIPCVAPMAGGTYGYTLCMGAVLGRVVAEFFKSMYPDIHFI